MKVLIVIANYRVANLTIECLHSIASEVAALKGAHVAICENGSGDDSEERISRAIAENGWDSWCTVTAITPNRGFTGGNNEILRPALRSEDPPQYIILLNADTIVRPHAVTALVDFLDRNPNVGIAGSRLEDPDGTPQRTPFRFHSPLSEFEGTLKLGLVSRLLNRWLVAPQMSDQAIEVEWLSGASMIIRREVFHDIGLLDEGYYTYFEDIDFCFNARKSGWSIWYVPLSRVVHLGGQSTGISHGRLRRQPGYLYEARRRYFLKNHGPLYTALADLGRILGLSLWRLRVWLGKPDSAPPYSLRDSIRHSVFLTGFKMKDVQNPAFVKPTRT